MISKHGSEEAVREFMAQSAKRVQNRGTAGFHSLAKSDPDRLSSISSMGGKARQDALKKTKTDELADVDSTI